MIYFNIPLNSFPAKLRKTIFVKDPTTAGTDPMKNANFQMIDLTQLKNINIFTMQTVAGKIKISNAS